MLSIATITAHYHNALIVSCIAYDRMVRTRKCHRLGCRKEGLTKENFLTAKACHSMEDKKKTILQCRRLPLTSVHKNYHDKMCATLPGV
jgi:hypothetical protein